MPPKKPTPSPRTLQKDTPGRVWRGFKDFGHGFLEFLKIILDFCYKVIKIILKFWIWIIGGIVLLVVGAALAFYLVLSGLGVKENEGRQEYLSSKVNELALFEKEARAKEVEEVEVVE